DLDLQIDDVAVGLGKMPLHAASTSEFAQRRAFDTPALIRDVTAITKCAFCLFPPPALCECGHRSLSGRRIAVRRRAVFVAPEGQSPNGSAILSSARKSEGHQLAVCSRWSQYGACGG